MSDPYFTIPLEGDGPVHEVFPWDSSEELGLAIHCMDETRLGDLAVKLDEYTRRAQISPNAVKVRDAICKMAVVDMLLRQDGLVEYAVAYDYAMEGASMYGIDLLIQSGDEHAAFLQEFDRAFNTIRSYAESGNQNVTGGTQLPIVD